MQKWQDSISNGTIGAIGELLVASDLLKNGYEVFRALSQSCSCDLIALKNGNLFKIEVRTGTYQKNKNVNFLKNSKIDPIFAVITHIDNKIHYFPELPWT